MRRGSKNPRGGASGRPLPLGPIAEEPGACRPLNPENLQRDPGHFEYAELALDTQLAALADDDDNDEEEESDRPAPTWRARLVLRLRARWRAMLFFPITCSSQGVHS